MKRNIFLIGMVAVAVTVLTGCNSTKAPKENVQLVKTDTVVNFGSKGTMQIPGKVKAADDVSMAFRVAGTIQRFHVKQGSQVRKGQLLVEMDSRDYQTQLQATEAEYKQIKAEAERVIALYKENSTTENNYDKAQYGLQQITAKLENHRNQLADTRLYAPFDGYVQQLLFDEHETVGAGMPVISFIGKNALEVEVNVPASTFIERDKMQVFTCTFDVFPGVTFPLEFLSVTQKANANLLYTMRLKLNPAEGKVPAAGMATIVKIMCSGEVSEVTVKSTAVFEDGGKSYVYVLKNGTLEKRQVTPQQLLSNGRMTLSAGVKAGEVVVSTGVHTLKNGEKVKPVAPISVSNVGGLL